MRVPNEPTGHISIHAPVKGATCEDSDKPTWAIISIHAPVKGATRQLSKQECR